MSDDILISKMRDVERLCEKYHTPRFSAFLDSREVAIVKSSGIPGMFFGGYDGAERCMFGVFPDWHEPCGDDFPIDAILITVKGEGGISHRQYLGTVLSLGIKREKIGDILVEDNRAYIFVSSDISEFIRENIRKIGRNGASAEFCDKKNIKLSEKKYKSIAAVCASERLDAVIAGLMNISRSEAKALIVSGRVTVNHFDVLKTDFSVQEGDLLSVRGFGRADVAEIGEKTRSDRIHMTFNKYI